MRSILHVDMDAFYASIEQRDHPNLKGKPIVVGGAEGRGVATTASYEARRYGLRSAMPISECKRRCPHVLCLPVNMHHYRRVSQQVMDILSRFSPLVEVVSVDEAFLDITGTEKLFGMPMEVAQQIQKTIQKELDLTCSIGIAWNKYLAKLASDMHKPNGLTCIRPQDLASVVWPLPISRMYGVGQSLEKALHACGIKTIGDLASTSPQRIEKIAGKRTKELIARARGEDDRPVNPIHIPQSIGKEVTFAEDLCDPKAIEHVLLTLSDTVGRKLRQEKMVASGLVLKWRYPNFVTKTKSIRLKEATCSSQIISYEALHLYRAHAYQQTLRLIGITATHLYSEDARQNTLFTSVHKSEALDKVLDEIQHKYGGSQALQRAHLFIDREKKDE